MSGIPPIVWMIVIGAVLILASFPMTTLDPSLGNAAFWLGVILIIIAVVVIVFTT
jgi:hypothetical protein